MKTISIVKFGKGYYLSARLSGRMMSHEFFKTKRAIFERIAELEHDGYVLQ